MRRGALGGWVAATCLIGCGGSSDGGSPATQASPTPQPAAEVTVGSSDERRDAREGPPEFGSRTTFRGRATRAGEPLGGARVELRDAEGDQVLAGTTTDDGGRYVLRERFSRNASVQVHVDGEPGPTVDVHRSVALGRADVREMGDGRNEFSGIVRYPRDIDPDLRFTLYLGSPHQRRLPRRPADTRLQDLGPGRSRVTFVFRPTGRWRFQLCVSPAADSGLSGPPGDCRGRSQANSAYREDAERRREEREADAGRGG